MGRDEWTHDALAAAMVAHLRRMPALPRGSRVAVFAEPDATTPIALAAHAAAGWVSVPLSPSLGAAELDHVLRDADPALVVGPAARCVPLGRPWREAQLGSADGPLPERAVDDEPLLLLYTSGTTGPPKGVPVTARAAAHCLDGLAATWGWTAADTVVHALPLFHVHGLVLGWFGVLRRGGAAVWIPRFDPHDVAEALQTSPSSVLFSVPTMVHRMSTGDDRVLAGLRAARLLVSGSAPLSAVDHGRLEERAGRSVIERYGLTETLIVTAARPGERLTVGAPLAGTELRRTDDDGGDAAPDAIGEVWVRGPSVFPGYWNHPDATAVSSDGWFRTGDLAVSDDAGRLRIVGRKATDLLKTGGYRVGAGEVEDALLSHPAVAEAAVIGVPDDDLGQRIVAYVVVREVVAAKALVEHVAARISAHKRPRDVHFVDALPRNAMGKVQKRALAGR